MRVWEHVHKVNRLIFFNGQIESATIICQKCRKIRNCPARHTSNRLRCGGICKQACNLHCISGLNGERVLLHLIVKTDLIFGLKGKAGCE